MTSGHAPHQRSSALAKHAALHVPRRRCTLVSGGASRPSSIMDWLSSSGRGSGMSRGMCDVGPASVLGLGIDQKGGWPQRRHENHKVTLTTSK